MKTLKKIIILVAIVVVGALDIFVYLNSHFYYRAQKEENIQKRIVLLEKSNKYCPLNDLVFYELGKSYFDLGIGSLNDMPASESSFQKSVQNLKKSILINPASPFSHFLISTSFPRETRLNFIMSSERPHCSPGMTARSITRWEGYSFRVGLSFLRETEILHWTF
jgi:hypothetical protein